MAARSRISRCITIVLVAGAFLSSCKDKLLPPAELESDLSACPVTPGKCHSGEISTEVWRASDNPHVLTDHVIVNGTLTIEPGALVQASAGVKLTVRTATGNSSQGGVVIAEGTATRPIVFTALNRSAPWGGIHTEGLGGTVNPSRFKHVRIEDATLGLSTWSTVFMDSSVIRRIVGTALAAVYYSAGSRISRTLIDSSGTGVYLEGTTLDEVIVRASRGAGIIIGRYGGGELFRTRIEGSAGIGLDVVQNGGSLKNGRHVRIVGSGSYPVSVHGPIFAMLWPTRADQDSLLGNARDTVIISGSIDGALTVRKDLPWILRTPIGWGGVTAGANSVLTLEPGASISGILSSIGRFDARGTSTDPVRLHATITLTGTRADTSQITNAVLTGSIATDQRHAVVIDQLRGLPGSGVALRAPGSRIANSSFDHPRFLSNDYGIALGGPGVQLTKTLVRNATGSGVVIETGGIQLQDCDVTGSSATGIHVTNAAGVSIERCNIELNAGAGVFNSSVVQLAARNNWWGDGSGPNGPRGDGAEGNVDVMPVSAVPFPTGPAPVTLSVATASTSMATGDTVRLHITARDAAGQLLDEVRWNWEISDTTVIRLADANGLVVGARSGSATITISARVNPAIRHSVTLAVTPGAPDLVWSVYDVPPYGMFELWASSPSNAIAVGHVGYALHFDGNSWRQVPMSPGEYFLSVSGLSNSDVWAVSHSAVNRYNGTRWVGASAPPDSLFTRIFALSSNAIYVGTFLGSVYRFDGSRWNAIGNGGRYTRSIWARSTTEVYAVFDTKGVLRFNGTGWESTNSPIDVVDLWGDAKSLYAVGRAGFFRYTGSGWQQLSSDTLSTVHALDPDNVFAAGPGSKLRHFGGSTVRPTLLDARADLWYMTAAPGVLYVYAYPNRIYVGKIR